MNEWPRLLFVCSANKLRSRTAEEMFRGVQGYQVRSRGTEPGARVRITAGDLGWADLVFVMEKRHRERIHQKLPGELAGKRVICLHIPDDYAFMEPALIALIRERVAPHLSPPPAWPT